MALGTIVEHVQGVVRGVPTLVPLIHSSIAPVSIEALSAVWICNSHFRAPVECEFLGSCDKMLLQIDTVFRNETLATLRRWVQIGCVYRLPSTGILVLLQQKKTFSSCWFKRTRQQSLCALMLHPLRASLAK